MIIKQWEYREEGVGVDLNRLGREGWELVTPIIKEGSQRYILKRPLSLTQRFTEEQKKALYTSLENKQNEKIIQTTRKLVNPLISKLVMSLGHTDMLLVADMGFPLHSRLRTIDVSISPGLPTVIDILNTIRDIFTFHKILVTLEMSEVSHEYSERLKNLFPGSDFEYYPHMDFKVLSSQCKAAIRTGDNTPYSNLILICG